ncbi:dihydrofolate reductase family protein [Dermatobacter hominis]|uniref:dihydrofolate reductase family protein n=1 Tax=Dermatobacter hominis TaxID=2884263 RepID=UPI001D11F394|nr:dihydrofolate reductase family protein [Dermatobacter hominis]UDY37050.1 dihydrofolate reductase family protein [Dermatobacter hominis]
MGQLIVTEFVTLDGIAQAPGGPDEDPESGFEFGGWQAPLIEDESGDEMFGNAEGMDALLLGRKTYDIFAGYWPTAPDEIPFTALLNRVPKYVASQTLSAPLAWEGSTLLEGDVAEAVAALKDRHESVHVIGSLDLLQTLLGARLVDRIHLWIYPIVLGTGKRVFEPGAIPTAFEVAEAVTYPRGTVHLALDAKGVPTTGDMTVDEPHIRQGGE